KWTEVSTRGLLPASKQAPPWPIPSCATLASAYATIAIATTVGRSGVQLPDGGAVSVMVWSFPRAFGATCRSPGNAYYYRLFPRQFDLLATLRFERAIEHRTDERERSLRCSASKVELIGITAPRSEPGTVQDHTLQELNRARDS